MPELTGLLQVSDADRVRTVVLDRPAALNAFDEALYDALTDALLAAAVDTEVAVLLLTGSGRAFSAGTDLGDMAARSSDPDFAPGEHGFLGLVETLAAFPKPLVIAVNGLALGIGTTILGYADLAYASTEARFKCPFTSLGVAPEAASSLLLPRLVGHQEAAWLLMSSAWLSAEEAQRIGLVRAVCEPDELLSTAHRAAATLARQPISSLIAVKDTLMAPLREQIAAARDRESTWFAELMGGPANTEAVAAFLEHREPDFTDVPGA